MAKIDVQEMKMQYDARASETSARDRVDEREASGPHIPWYPSSWTVDFLLCGVQLSMRLGDV